MRAARVALGCLLAAWVPDALAQTYSKTEQVHYHDDMDLWVLGQTSRVQLIQAVPAQGGLPTEISRTVYDPVTALPLQTYAFTRLQQTLTYHADGTIASVSDGRDAPAFDTTIRLQNWMRGVPQTVRFPATPEAPAGATLTVAVNDHGWINAVTDEIGATTSYLYDDMGRIRQVTYPGEDPALGVSWNDTTSDFSWQAGAYGLPPHWRRLTSTGNARAIIHYDALWRPVVEEHYDQADPATTRSIVAKRYDAAGRLAFQSHPMRTLADYRTVTAGTYTQYDALGRVTEVRVPSIDAPGGYFRTTTEYLPGFKQRNVSPNLTSTTIQFMAWDQPATDYPVAFSHPEGAFTDIARDAFGKPTAITRRNANSTIAVSRHLVYDSTSQELCKTMEPETGTTAMEYDAAGNLVWSAAGLDLPGSACDQASVPLAARTERSYDARNRLKTLAFPDGNGNQAWNYLADGKPQQIVTWNIGVPGAAAAETRNEYTYYKRGLVKTEVIDAPAWYMFLVEHGYNANGHEATLTYPSGHAITRTLNALGQATAIAGGGTTYASGISYHANGSVAGFAYGNNIQHTMLQNDRQLPDAVASAHGGTQFLHDEYDYDGHGNVLAITDIRSDAHGARSRTMGYDELDRLTSVASPMYGSEGASYTYNVLDDITAMHIGGARARNHAYHYDANRRLSSIRYGQPRPARIDLEYDAQGNLAKRTDRPGSRLYRFDYGNRLREVEGIERYRYDGHGRRVVAMNFATGVLLTQYGLDGKLLFQHSARTDLTTDNIYLGNSLLAIRERSLAGGAPTVKYQHTDALGSPVVVTRQDRSIVEESEYEPYGQVLNRPMHDGPGFTGHAEDAATGLVHMEQRYYDPEIGAFLSVDPVTAYSSPISQFHRYRYANSNPYKFTDPDGRESSAIRSMERDNRAYLQGRMSAEEVTANREARGIGAAVGATGVVASVVAVESGAVAGVTTSAVRGANAVRRGHAAVGAAADSASLSTGLATQKVVNTVVNGVNAVGAAATSAAVRVMAAVESEVSMIMTAAGASPSVSSSVASQVSSPAFASEVVTGAISGAANVPSPATSVPNFASTQAADALRKETER